MYLDQMPSGEHARSFSGKRLDPTVFEKVLNFSQPFPKPANIVFIVDVFGTAWSII